MWIFGLFIISIEGKNVQSKKKAAGNRTVNGNSKKIASAAIPRRIRIRREAGYHTHHIGTCKNGDQFMAFIVGIPLRKHVSVANRKLVWYAVIHRFNSAGEHLGTEASLLGKAVLGSELADAEAIFKDMIGRLGPVTYRDIEVRLFSVRIGGHAFGLVDASVPEDGYQRVDLLPNGLAFFPPWNGNYDT